MSGRDTSRTTSGDTLVAPGHHERVRNLLDVIAEIEQYSVAETGGSVIPEKYFTTRDRLDFFMVGLKSTLAGAIITILFTPFAFGVVDQLIPVFGSLEPSLFDRIFAFMMALSFTLGYAFFYAQAAGNVSGNITRAMVRNLLGGVAFGAMIKAVFGFMLYHAIYFLLLDERVVVNVLRGLDGVLSAGSATRIYYWLGAFRPVFLTSSWFLILAAALTIAIPWLALARTRMTHNRTKGGF